jgi:membrane protein implicated in regulation of membrane protease activity
MDKFDTNTVLISLGTLAIIAEMLLGAASGFDLLIIGIILIVSGATGMLLNSVLLPFVLILILSLIYLFGARELIKKRLAVTTKATNTEALLGRRAVVVKRITSHTPGRVKLEGEQWRATASSTIDEGSEVRIQSVSGVTLTVHPV